MHNPTILLHILFTSEKSICIII